jgi:NADPH:quinone reductase-like Zn-dependent oxidoreductase
MKAIVQRGYGPPEDVLGFMDVEPPVPEDQQVLVRVEGAGVAIGDWLVATGLPYFARATYGISKPKHPIRGFEVSGTVEELGDGARGFSVGDPVFGWSDGAFAEYVAVPAGSLAIAPTTIPIDHSAGVPVSGVAALQALRDAGELRSGQRLLVIGASGGVGTFAVQIAKAFGAEVTGVCDTKNVDLVRSIGADDVIDYRREEIDAAGRRYDVIVDLAGNRRLSILRAALTPHGTLVLVGGSGGRWSMGMSRTVRAVTLSPFVGQRLRAFFSSARRADLIAVRDLIEVGELTPVIDRTFPLSSTIEAIEYVGRRHTRGKTVIQV